MRRNIVKMQNFHCLGPKSPIPAPMSKTFGSLRRAKYRVDRCNESPLLGEIPRKNRPRVNTKYRKVSDVYSGAKLSVTIRLKHTLLGGYNNLKLNITRTSP